MNVVWNLKRLIGKGYKKMFDFKGRYLVIKGGRGSKKSYTTALWHIMKMMEDPNTNTLVLRKTGATLRDSVHAQLKVAIKALDVEHLWKVSVSPMEMMYIPTGQKILFRGLDEASKITSMTVDKGYLTYVWIEEAFEVTNEDEFNKIDTSIRGYRPPGTFNRITFTFNPWSNVHWLNTRFFEDRPNDINELRTIGRTIHYEDELELVMTTNFKINEFLSESDIALFSRMEVQNPRRFHIEGIGDWGIAEGLVFENWEVKAFDPIGLQSNKKLNLLDLYGADFGYTNDPSTLIKLLVDRVNYTIYVCEEHYQHGMTNKMIAEAIKAKGWEGKRIAFDIAERKSIDEIKTLGVPYAFGNPNKQTILAGIQWLQNYKIIVHPSCRYTAEELSMYCWTKDRDANLMNKPIDKYNHILDAIRYSCYNLIGERKVKSYDINDII